MGIPNLMSLIEKACSPCKISEFRGRTVAVDACCWLHKGVYGCADRLAVGGQTDSYVRYCMKLVNTLLFDGLRVIMVFDGASLPAKRLTNETRKQQREIARDTGHRLLAEGSDAEASKYFRRSVSITFEMISNVIKACKALNRDDLDCIVAPYEADAQLAYLNLNGFADIVISEDTDLVPFGCKKVIFKYDHVGGILYQKELLPGALANGGDFDFITFRRSCILSGCDYTDGLAGIGLKKASQFFGKVSPKSKSDIRTCLKRIPLVMNMLKVKVTDEFVNQFIMAENTFQYQLVFDPKRRKLAPLNPYRDGIDAADMPYAGELLDNELVVEIAMGNICPRTHRPIERPDSTTRAPGRMSRSSNGKCQDQLQRSPIRTSKRRYSPVKAAFEIDRGRVVKTIKRSPRKANGARTGSSNSHLKSSHIDAYNCTYSNERPVLLSCYFTSTPQTTISKRENIGNADVMDVSPVVNSVHPGNSPMDTSTTTPKPRSSKKRSIFDLFGDDKESEDSGFYESSGSISGSPTDPSSPVFRNGITTIKKSPFRIFNSEDKHDESPSVLASFGTKARFQYRTQKF